MTVKKGVGCLLAHTMGLGKTLQIIAFLITLSTIPPKVPLEMPEALKSARAEDRDLRFMVVCPPGIVVNWSNEFKRWTPRNCLDVVGDVVCVDDVSFGERMRKIRKWFDRGGVLLSIFSYYGTDD